MTTPVLPEIFLKSGAMESDHHSQQDYPAVSVISLVTCNQREDSRWFGANIPDRIKSVEFVRVSVQPKEPPSYSYKEYEGSPLGKDNSPGTRCGQRRDGLASLSARGCDAVEPGSGRYVRVVGCNCDRSERLMA